MFFRPENETSNSIIFVLGVLFYLNFSFIIILFLIYELLSIKERNSSFNTQAGSISTKLFV